MCIATDQFTSEIVQLQDQLLALQELTQPGAQLDIEAALQRVVQTAGRAIKVEMTLIRITLPDQDLWQMQATTQTFDPELLHDAYEWVQANGHYLRSHDSSYDFPHPPGVDNVLVLPVSLNGRIMGTLTLLNKQNGRFQATDIKLGQAITKQLATQLENILFYQESLRQVRTAADLQLAHDVQQALFPQQPPTVPGVHIWAHSQPARQVGGDFYDFNLTGGETLNFCVGDVSGKGMAAGLLMAMTRTSLQHATVLQQTQPAQTLAQTNHLLYTDFTNVSMFATLFVGQYSPQTRQLTYANAGHAPVIYCPANQQAVLLEADGAPLGVLPDSLSENHQVSLQPDDLLLIASDGFTEAANAAGEMFGYERLLQAVTFLAGLPAPLIADALLSLIADFVGDEAQADDQTLVILQGTN